MPEIPGCSGPGASTPITGLHDAGGGQRTDGRRRAPPPRALGHQHGAGDLPVVVPSGS